MNYQKAFLFLTCLSQAWALSAQTESYPEKFPPRILGIMAYDSDSQVWAYLLASDVPAIGNQAPQVSPEGIRLILSAYSEATRLASDSIYIQDLGLQAQGHFAKTGEAFRFRSGYAGHRGGNNYLVFGNGLNDAKSLEAMERGFTKGFGTLGQKLIQSAAAGQLLSRLQSAVLWVSETEGKPGSGIYLRADLHPRPLEEIGKMLNYRYGTISLKESIAYLKVGQTERGQELLANAMELLPGHYVVYPQLILACEQAGQSELALGYLEEAQAADEQFEFYHPDMYPLIKHANFAQLWEERTQRKQDWARAIRSYLDWKQVEEAIRLINQKIKEKPENGEMYFLLGQAYEQKQSTKLARKSYKKALSFDPDHVEAQRAYDRLQKKK